MSKLMYKDKPIGGTVNNASQVNIFPIDGMNSNNVQDGLYELNQKIKNSANKTLTATLIAGQTTLTLTDTSITSNSIVDNVLASVQGVTYESIKITEGALTMTFDKQAVDVLVKVVIR